MALQKGMKRFRSKITGEIRYFSPDRNIDENLWEKIGTPGSKNWRWITNGNVEKYVHDTVLPEGYYPGRVKK